MTRPVKKFTDQSHMLVKKRKKRKGSKPCITKLLLKGNKRWQFGTIGIFYREMPAIGGRVKKFNSVIESTKQFRIVKVDY